VYERFCSVVGSNALRRLVLCSHRSYFRSKWNCLDGFVVTVSLVAIAFPQVKIFRSFRALRPLRIIVRSKKIQVRHLCHCCV
jgi:hypothetical protein